MVEFSEHQQQADKEQQTTSANKEGGGDTVQEGSTSKEDLSLIGEEVQPEKAGEASEEVQNIPSEGLDSEISSELEKIEKEDELELVKEQLALKEQEAQSYYDRLLRLQAEFENFRKRMIREKAEFTKYAQAEFLKDLLPVLDNLERALVSAEQLKDFEGFSKGVEMIFKQFCEIIRKAGLTDIEALNQPFDPTIHEAVARVESSEVENNTVVEVLQKGYYLHDKVLRPAKVKVAIQPS